MTVWKCIFSGRFFTCPVKMPGKAKVFPDKWASLSDSVCWPAFILYNNEMFTTQPTTVGLSNCLPS